MTKHLAVDVGSGVIDHLNQQQCSLYFSLEAPAGIPDIGMANPLTAAPLYRGSPSAFWNCVEPQ
jgi:hypothetical protein